jgi:hypothetical protein
VSQVEDFAKHRFRKRPVCHHTGDGLCRNGRIGSAGHGGAAATRMQVHPHLRQAQHQDRWVRNLASPLSESRTAPAHEADAGCLHRAWVRFLILGTSCGCDNRQANTFRLSGASFSAKVGAARVAQQMQYAFTLLVSTRSGCLPGQLSLASLSNEFSRRQQRNTSKGLVTSTTNSWTEHPKNRPNPFWSTLAGAAFENISTLKGIRPGDLHLPPVIRLRT